MESIPYNQDPTELILSQIKHQNKLSNKNNTKIPHSYFQVQYTQKQIMKLNPEEARRYEKSPQQQYIKEYIDESARDQLKYQQFKYGLTKKFFNLKRIKPPKTYIKQFENEPLEMIKSFSQPEAFLLRRSCNSNNYSSKNETSHLAKSMIFNSKRSLKQRLSDEFQQILQDSKKLTVKKNKYKLKGNTMIQKQKMNQQIMRQQKELIMNVMHNYQFNLNRPSRVNEISNKQKYSMDYIEYLKTKTKNGLDKHLYEKRIRGINGNLQYFQEFILRQGKLKHETVNKLENIYMKMRQQFRNVEKRHSHYKKLSKSKLNIDCS